MRTQSSRVVGKTLTFIFRTSLVLVLVLIVSSLTASHIMAQTAADTAAGKGAAVISGLLSSWPMWAKIVSALGIVSEILSWIPSSLIPANGVFGAVFGFVNWIVKGLVSGQKSTKA
jgi:hypothetical protein